MHRSGSLFAMLVLLSGCLTRSAMPGVVASTEGLASPGPALVGTWRGMAMATAGELTQTTAPIVLTVRSDGTWSWSRRGTEQGGGRAYVRTDRVLLDLERGTDAGRTIQLRRRGDTLWGVTPTFVPGAMSSVQLEKVES